MAGTSTRIASPRPGRRPPSRLGLSVGDGVGAQGQEQTDKGGGAAKAVDGDAATRWSSGHGMQAGDWFQLDLGSTRTLDQIVLDTSASSGDFARQYEAYTSDDGTPGASRSRPGRAAR